MLNYYEDYFERFFDNTEEKSFFDSVESHELGLDRVYVMPRDVSIGEITNVNISFEKDENGEEEYSPVEERFNTQEEAFEWIAKELHHPVASVEDIENWSEELAEADEGFIALHEVE